MSKSNNNSSSDSDDEPPKLLWSCVTRDDTILAEAAVQDFEELSTVGQTAQELLRKKATPGFEYHSGSLIRSSLRQERRFKGVKFHVYEHVSRDDDEEEVDEFQPQGLQEWQNDNTNETPHLRIWVFAAVYDPLQATVKEVQSFLEKMVTLTENFREHDPVWLTAGTLGLQATFAPILKQRMEQVTYLGDMAQLDQKIQACQLQMEQNIDLILERGDKIEALEEDATRMQEMASVFKKRAKKVKKLKMMQNAKHGLILGTAITAGVSAIVIPPLVAIL